MRRDRDGLLVTIPEGDYVMEAYPVPEGPFGPGLYLGHYRFPPDLRGGGLGAKYYQRWESMLPGSVARIYLHSLETARAFWLKMGYVDVFRDDDVSGIMVKELIGPDPIPLLFDPDDMDYYEDIWVDASPDEESPAWVMPEELARYRIDT